jgi:hypothetical protein
MIYHKTKTARANVDNLEPFDRDLQTYAEMHAIDMKYLGKIRNIFFGSDFLFSHEKLPFHNLLETPEFALVATAVYVIRLEKNILPNKTSL